MSTISEPKRRDRRILTYGAGLLVPAAVLLVAWPRLATNLFATGFGEQVFMPHGMCYLWVPQLWLMHVSSDLLIGVSYVAISSTLIYLIYRARHDIPFSWVFLAFGVFIFSCSITHFMEAWTIWHATYWLSGYVKLLTAAASVATAVVLPFLVPLTRFAGDGRLEMSNNAAERAIRPIALGRKNYLFAGSDAGGRRTAIMYTLIETAKLNDVDPEAWLTDVIPVEYGTDL